MFTSKMQSSKKSLHLAQNILELRPCLVPEGKIFETMQYFPLFVVIII